MSWMKRPQGGAPPPPGPDPQAYAAPQAFGSQHNMYGNYQGGTPGNAQQQQQFWQMPPQQQPHQQQQQQYNQQYGQVYQQEYAANANQYYQPPAQYNQSYNQTYTGVQPGYQQNSYQNQGAQQNYPQNKTNTDAWEDNWDWGWEDSSKQGQKGPAPNAAPLTVPQHTQLQPQVFNNANVIEESFAPTDSWNWAAEDKKDANDTQPPPTLLPENNQAATLPVQNTPMTDNNTENEVNVHSQRSPSSHSTHQPTEEIKTLNDRDVVKERLPNLALGKRFHLDNLTPQWSIESQMSQESSDGPHTHSEGTYRSENQSRNSSKSSPGLNTESSNFNYSQPGIEELYPQHNIEWSKQSIEDPTLVDRVQSSSSRQESHDELSNSLQEMSISNSENPAPDNSLANREVESRNSQDNVAVALQPSPSVSPANFPPPAPLSQPPGTSASAHVVGSVSQATGMLPPSSSSSSLPPPSSFPPPMSSQNPYKHAGPFSHKTTSKVSPGNPSPMQPFTPQSNLTSPAVVNKVSQHNRVALGFGANLETAPDNSERPDQPQAAPFRPLPIAPQVPDNLEVAPRNDRNEYLQTAHLSSADYGENTDFSRNAPPPGLRRMVVGQQESEYGQNINLTSDEPPPGLARMVPGQQTESESSYNQPSENYMDRHIDGGPIDGVGRPYRQAEGQQTSDNYTQPPSARGNERRPIGLDRMVPGEPSNDDYSQYQGAPYAGANEQRVVTGLDHEYSISTDPSPSDVREQNMDGSDYTEQTVRNPSRSIIGARESSNDVSSDYGARPEEQQREVVMEGENLQDLSVISSTELSFSREPTFEGADVPAVEGSDRKPDAPESLEHSMHSSGSRRQSLNHGNTSGDDSERDRLVKSSPRREKHKPSRERDKEGRYSRGDRKYERDSDRRSGRDERRSERHERERPASPEARRARRTRERDGSPDARRTRRSTRSHRYEPDDTDYYSDRERHQRRQREGSYTSKPPRHDGERRYRDERDRDRDRDRRYTSDRHRDRYEQRYRDIDPSRKYGNLRKEREDDRKRVVTFSSDAKSSDSSRKEGEAYSPSRAESREPTGTDDERDPRRRDRRSRHKRTDPYYDAYGSAGAGGYPGDPYLLQRQQYEYYERLRASDPAAYMQLYKLMAAQPHDYMASVYGEGYVGAGAGYESAGAAGREGREGREGRGSGHSGRSSAGLKGHDTDLNTDASLNLQLEESTVRSERMTPFRYSTAHIKGSISSRHVVVVAAAYPVDGRPARVTLRSLGAALAHTPQAAALLHYPGPLVKGVTHKKSVIEYCLSRAREADSCVRDRVGYALVWDLLALLLRQNGVVVGTDIAELLMKNTREYEYYNPADKAARPDSRRESSLSGAREDEPTEEPDFDLQAQTEQPRTESASPRAFTDEAAALDKFREYLIYGNRQEALEFAMSRGLWGHALLLSWHGAARARAQAAARFVAALPPRDPLHSLYLGLAAKQPPVATCVSDESWGDWRPHAAIILSNTSTKPDQDRRTLVQLGDTLMARGLPYCAQFCYISGGVQWAAHPLAPMAPPASAAAPASAPASAPRLTLLLADPKAQTFNQHATDEAIFATEIYEYALSLNQDYYIKELQVYKLVLATRLVDVGQYERALAYTERAARCVTRAPRDHAPALLRALASLADRLRYHDPILQEDAPLVEEGAESGEPSPRHQQWLDDVTSVADALTAEASAQSSPQHAAPAHAHADYYAQPQYAWGEQAQQHYQQPAQPYPEPAEEPQEYPQYYQPEYAQPPAPPAPEAAPTSAPGAAPAPAPAPGYGYGYDENNYWQPQDQYGYSEGGGVGGVAGDGGGGASEEAAEARPMITMPGANAGASALYAGYDDDRPPSQDTDRETDTPKASGKNGPSKDERADTRRGGGGGGGSGWLGGILTRLSLRPPNQMILPDDKNPTIVWDAEHKRWRNLDAGDDEHAARPPAPPPVAPVVSPPAGAPPAAPTSNIFKMQKGRHIKKSYVDVFNPSGAATRPLPPAADVLGPPPPAPTTPSYFVPQPTHQSGIFDPTAAGDDDRYNTGI